VVLHLNPQLVRQIESHGGSAYPHECCGALLGRLEGDVKHVTEVHPVNNAVHENRERRYLITPDEYRLIEQVADERGLEFLGLYHSHPDHPARPSQFDLDHAMPWWSYVIVSVVRGLPEAIRSWILRGDRSGFDEEEIRQKSEEEPASVESSSTRKKE